MNQINDQEILNWIDSEEESIQLSEKESLKELTSNVYQVKKFFKDINFDLKFFIAGGSVFSLLNKSNVYSDIDVYLYSEQDVQEFIQKFSSKYQITLNKSKTIGDFEFLQTKNSINIRNLDKDEKRIQVIILKNGDIPTIFSTFDLNCSECAITSELEIHKSDRYSKIIKVNFNNFRASTLGRYNKYISTRPCIDANQIALTEIFRFLLRDINKEFIDDYIITSTLKSYEILSDYITTEYSKEDELMIYNLITELDNKYYQIEIFQKLDSLVISDEYYISQLSDEYSLVRILNYENFKNTYPYNYALTSKINRFEDSSVNRIKTKYPEFFI